MNYQLFCKYVPAINAYLNGNEDKEAKRWDDVVEVFYQMNKDETIKFYANMALVFVYASKPSYLCIPSRNILPYVSYKNVSVEYLDTHEYEPNIDYIIDESGTIRFSFTAFRRLIFSEGNHKHIQAFEFTDKIYQMFCRYQIKMITRDKVATHYCIIEKTKNLTKGMQLHNTKRKYMNECPRAFKVIKGSSKKVRSMLANYIKKDDYADESLIPIYETVLPNAEDEIEMIADYMINTHLIPYRNAYAADNQINVKFAKYNLKINKKRNLILVDPSSFTVDQIEKDINMIRLRVKRGEIFCKKDKNQDAFNQTSIERFIETQGTYIDDLNRIVLKQSYEDVTLVDYNSEDIAMLSIPVPLESEHGDSDNETVMSDCMSEYSVSFVKRSSSRETDLQPTVEETEEDDEDDPPVNEETKSVLHKMSSDEFVYESDGYDD